MAGGLARSRRRSSSPARSRRLFPKSDPWTDLALTLPILVVYHLGVVFLPIRNAADILTDNLVSLAAYNLYAYTALAVGIALILVASCIVLGRGRPFRREGFLRVLAEGTLYAIVMRAVASTVALNLPLASFGSKHSPFSGLIMSLGAGFYEEVAFRVGLFGLGVKLLAPLKPNPRWFVPVLWGLIAAAIFSGWHYWGPMSFTLESFVFRWVCGIVLTLIYSYRGFATAVWTHALYDIWVLVL